MPGKGNTKMDTNFKRITEVMTSKVWQVSADQTAEATLALMRHKSVSSVLVTEGETILGIITERDIVRAVHQGAEIKAMHCIDLMQSPVITVTAETRCLDAYRLMSGRGIRHLAITDAAGHILGITSEGDLMRDFGIEYFMNFKDIGSAMSPHVCRLQAAATVAEAVALMIEQRQSCVVVVDAQGAPAGVLTERDIVRLCNERTHPERLTLAETMCSPVKTARPQEALHDAVKTMREAHIRRLIVVDDSGAVCGLLTHHDIVRGLDGENASQVKEILDTQTKRLQEAGGAINEKLLLTNLLRLANRTALLAAGLDHRIAYGTSAVADVLGLPAGQIDGQDIRKVLTQLGWQGAAATLSEASLSGRTQRCTVSLKGGQEVDLQVSRLLDGQNHPQGYLVLAQKARRG